MPESHSAVSAWGQVTLYADRLFQALDRLDELGGSPQAIEAGRWSAPAVDRAIGTLLAAREGLDTEIRRLERHRRRMPRPARRRTA